MDKLSRGRVVLLLIGLAAVVSIAVFVFSVSFGRELAIRSWEIRRQDMQKSMNSRDWSKAEELGQQCVALAGDVAAKDFRVAVSLADLADVLLQQEKNTEALNAYKRASEFEQGLTHDTASGAELFSEAHLGHLYYQMGLISRLIDNPKQAARYFKKSAVAFESIKKKGAKKDLFIAQELVGTVIAQAQTATQLKQSSDDQLRYYRKALKLCTECNYPAQEVALLQRECARLASEAGQTVETACSQSTWAQLVQQANTALEAGQLIDFQRLMKESISGCENDKSRQILSLISLRKLAKFYVSQRRYADAIDVCKRGLAVWKEMGDGGDSEADTLYTMLFRSTTDPREREAIERLQLELRIKLYGHDDFHVAETSTRLAVLANALGDRTTTKSCIDRAYDIYNRSRLKRRGIGTDLIDLGNLLFEFGEYNKAENIYQRALKIWSQSPNKHIALRIDVLTRLHNVYEKLDLRMEMNRVDEERMRLQQLPEAQ